jgi:hypothetical protein
LASACKVPDPPPITERWVDDFSRDQIGNNYLPTSEVYRVKGGELWAHGAYNHPLWLRKKLPHDVEVEFDCWSRSSDGDIKVEIFGNGESYDRDRGAYTSTGYVAVLGGWNNTRSILARGDEHGAKLAESKVPRVELNRRYHWKLSRRGSRLSWFVDDMKKPFLTFTDPEPLEGDGHLYFGFNNWASDTRFVNLVITPLTPRDLDW